MDKTEVLFDMARSLALVVTKRALVLAGLPGLCVVAPQGTEPGETLAAGADVGLVLGLGGMLFQLVFVWEGGGACGACVCRVRLVHLWANHSHWKGVSRK